MFRRSEPMGLSHRNEEDRTSVVVAGPGRATTIPGIIVSEIVHAVSLTAPVSRIEVDLGLDYTVGLHRAPSLAVAHRADAVTTVASRRAPDSARFRAQAFRDWLGPDVKTAIAYAWPGIDNSWIKPFVQIARTRRASPRSSPSRACRGRRSCAPRASRTPWRAPTSSSSATRPTRSGSPGPLGVLGAPSSRRTRRCRCRVGTAAGPGTRSPRSSAGGARAPSRRCSPPSTRSRRPGSTSTTSRSSCATPARSSPR